MIGPFDKDYFTFKMYQKLASQTAIYPNKGDNLIYPVLGLVGESGEVAEKLKKIIRDDGGILSSAKREEFIKELGDVIWYISAVCEELKVEMGDVAKGNIEKLHSRKDRGVLTGSGDNR